jgi:ketosteroid isomerase-like protein
MGGSLDTCKRALELWNAYDVDGLVALYAPEAEMSFVHYAPWVEEELHHGHDEVRAVLQGWLDSWDDHVQGVDEFIEVGDENVVWFTWQEGRGTESGAPMRVEWTQVVTVRDGLIQRVEHYSDRQEALRAAGAGDEGQAG